MKMGQHLLIECKGRHAMLNQDELATLMTRAALAGGATILSQCFHQFGGHGGVTGVLILAESHITVHTWPEHQYAAFDVFMCGDAQPMQAAEIIAEQFSDAEVAIKSADRGYQADAGSDFTVLTTDSGSAQCHALPASINN